MTLDKIIAILKPIVELFTLQIFLDMEKTYKNPDGTIISVVNNLSPQLESETVFHGKDTAEVLSLYLDGDRTAPAYGPNRPRLRIQFAPDGKTITNIVLLNDPQGAEFEWQR